MKNRIVSGIMVTMFLVTMVAFAIPVRVSAEFDGEIPLGLIGPKGWIAWDGVWEGGRLAADLINYPEDYGLPGPGGMKSGEDRYKVVLVDIDEHVVPVPDPTAAVAELLSALENNPNMKILLGGFRTEVVLPMRDAAMDYAAEHGRPIWLICGASEDYVIDCGGGDIDPNTGKPKPFCGACVRCDYERYKYMYRITPINSTSLGLQLGALVAQFIVPKMKAIFGIDPDPRVGGPLPAYLVAEDLAWCRAIVESFLEGAEDMGIDFVGVARPSVIETDFSPILDMIEGSGAKMIVHVFSAVAGATFIKQWGERKVPAVPVGINVESQLEQFWAETGGKCEYETIMGGGSRNMINPDAEPLNTIEYWDLYLEKFGHNPIYTADGVYGAILGINQSTRYAETLDVDCDTMITEMFDHWGERVTDNVTQQAGAVGWFTFTSTHDVYQEPVFSLTAVWPGRDCPPYDPEEVPWARALLPQWQAGRREVVWPRGHWCVSVDPDPLTFARKWKVPPWVYSLAETDFAGGTPLQNPPAWIEPSLPGYFGSFPLPDGEVGTEDIGTVTRYWQDTVPWTVLEADMDGNQFIDIDDVARVALDWGKTA